jgi:ferritin-like metal-binding protein YciE
MELMRLNCAFGKRAVEDVHRLYFAENHLAMLLPKLAKRTQSPVLKELLEAHATQTVEHRSRLGRVLQGLGEPSKGFECSVMQGLSAQLQMNLFLVADDRQLDPIISMDLRQIKHQEIAIYKNVFEAFGMLRLSEIVTILKQPLAEDRDFERSMSSLVPNI